MRRATLLTVLLVAVIALGGVSSVAGQNASDAGDYSLGELSESGTQIEGKDPSSRYLGTSGMIYLSYQETNLVKELGSQDPEWAIDKVVTPGKTVDTTEVTAHVTRMRGAEPETVNVTVISWNRGEKTVELPNGSTTTEPTAVNVTEQTHQVELTGGGDKFTIPLPTAEQRTMTTVVVEGYPEARWVFPRKTVATAYELPFGTTWGSFLPWFMTRFFGTVVIGVPVAIGGAIKTLDEYGAGPGKGAMWYLIVLGIGGYFASYFALGEIANVIVSLPWVLGLLVVSIAYLATLEYAERARTILVEQIVTEDAENALGEGVPDIAHERHESVKAVELEDGETALVPKGGSLRHFAVLLLGAEPATLDTQEFETRFESEGDLFDEKLYADEDSEELLSIRWPSLSLGTSGFRKTVRESRPALEGDVAGEVATDGGTIENPEWDANAEYTEQWDRDKLTTAFLYGAVGTLLGSVLLGGTQLALLVGAIPALWVGAELTDGNAEFVEAPAHATPAKAARVSEQHELDVARTFEDLQEGIASLEEQVLEEGLDVAEAYISESRGRLDRLLRGGTDDESPRGGRAKNGDARDFDEIEGDLGDD